MGGLAGCGCAGCKCACQLWLTAYTKGKHGRQQARQHLCGLLTWMARKSRWRFWSDFLRMFSSIVCSLQAANRVEIEVSGPHQPLPCQASCDCPATMQPDPHQNYALPRAPDKAVNVHLPRLADSVAPVLRLSIHGRVPVCTQRQARWAVATTHQEVHEAQPNISQSQQAQLVMYQLAPES